MKVSTVLDKIDSGAIALPELQRGYVWSRRQVRDLVRSLYWRFPSRQPAALGNHIVQAAGGRARRECAERFVDVLRRTATADCPPTWWPSISGGRTAASTG